MAIREDLVASAMQFLQDPNVASSSVENRISFMRSKNLTQEEIDVALARSSGGGPSSTAPMYPGHSGPPQPYYQPYPQNAWQPPPPPPQRDWRDWFIMATVVGGVGYGLYSIGKRYVMPIVAPPTPEKLEQDKKSIEEQFDRAFALVEQLSKDTEDLKKAEQQRTERLDTTLSDLESVMADLKTANRRREDDAQRIRDEVQALKDAIPKALNNQKDLTDNRLREINTELGSLKTLVSQRMNASSAPSANPLRPASGNASVPPTNTSASKQASVTDENNENATPVPEAPKTAAQSNFNRPASGRFNSGPGKASIPDWQKAALAGSASTSESKGESEEANVSA